MQKNLIDDLTSASPNRRSFLKKVGFATAAIGTTAIAGTSTVDAKMTTEVDILNFALNLEYLEAEFYTYATTGKSITSFGIGIKGHGNGENPTTGATTVGGKKVTFTDNELFTHERGGAVVFVPCADAIRPRAVAARRNALTVALHFPRACLPAAQVRRRRPWRSARSGSSGRPSLACCGSFRPARACRRCRPARPKDRNSPAGRWTSR